MAHDYYVRTTSGSYRDDRHEFGSKWQGVAAEELTATHFNDPKLEIVTAEEHRHRKGKKGERPDDAESGEQVSGETVDGDILPPVSPES